MQRSTRFFIEGYDARNWGDVLMATASANLLSEIMPNGEILFARELPYSPSNFMQIFGKMNVNAAYGGKPAWNVFFKTKGPFDISYRARHATKDDVLLFCNGYIFGDPWPTKWLLKLSKVFTKLHARGVKIILMPQSYGPFERIERKPLLRSILESTALILTRDRQSRDYLSQAGLTSANVVQAIDYTGMLNDNLAFPVKSSYPKRLCIIPNIKIREKYGDDAARQYTGLLISLVQQAQVSHGLDVAVVHHTAGKDESLIQSLISEGGANMTVQKEDPLLTRRFIGESGFVVSSRFHGVVNGLSQNIPVISLGWSHKYSEIMKHYGMQDFSLVGDRFHGVPTMLNALIAERDLIAERLNVVNGTTTSACFKEIRQRVATTVFRRS